MIGYQTRTCVGCEVGESRSQERDTFTCTVNCPISQHAALTKQSLASDPRYEDLIATISLFETLTGDRFKTSEILEQAENLSDEELADKVMRVRAMIWPLLREHPAEKKSSRRAFLRHALSATLAAAAFEVVRHQIHREFGVDIIGIESLPTWAKTLR